MRRPLPLLLALTLLVPLADHAQAADQPAAPTPPPAAAAPGLSVELSAAPAEVAVGDAVTVTVIYRWPAGWRVERTPDPGEDFRGAFVTDAPPAQQTTTAEGVRRVVRLTIATTRSGAWALPRPALTAIPPSGAAPAAPLTVRAPAVIVQVGSEASPPKLPPPIAMRLRPPAVAAPDQRWWLLAGGGALALAAGLWWVLRRRAAVAVVPPPSAVFADELARLRQVQEPRELGAGLSLAIRRYMGAIWSFDAAGSTVREIAGRQRGIGLCPERFQDLARILQQLDDLRWAAGDLDRAQVAPQLQAAQEQVALIEAERAAIAARAAAGVIGDEEDQRGAA